MFVMFELEAHKGPLGFFISPGFYDGKASEHFRGPAGESRKVTLKEDVWAIDYGIGYEIGQWRLGEAADSPTLTVEPFVGGLYLCDKIKTAPVKISLRYTRLNQCAGKSRAKLLLSDVPSHSAPGTSMCPGCRHRGQRPADDINKQGGCTTMSGKLAVQHTHCISEFTA